MEGTSSIIENSNGCLLRIQRNANSSGVLSHFEAVCDNRKDQNVELGIETTVEKQRDHKGEMPVIFFNNGGAISIIMDWGWGIHLVRFQVLL